MFLVSNPKVVPFDELEGLNHRDRDLQNQARRIGRTHEIARVAAVRTKSSVLKRPACSAPIRRLRCENVVSM